MTADDLKRFAEDLRLVAGIKTELELDRDPKGLHVLRINGVDFYFHADRTGYDGWGRAIGPPKAKPPL